MNVLELLFIAALAIIVILLAKAFGSLLGIADWYIIISLVVFGYLTLRCLCKMNAPTPIYLASLTLFVIFGSRVIGHLFGVSEWYFIIPLIACGGLIMRWIGRRLYIQRMQHHIIKPKNE